MAQGPGYTPQPLVLTKREYFAIMCLQGTLSNPEAMEYVSKNYNDHIKIARDRVIESAVLYADSLIEALNKQT
jgi:hypothetical protein